MCITYARSAYALSTEPKWLRDIVAEPQWLITGLCTSMVQQIVAVFRAAVAHAFYSSACMSSMTAQMATVGTGQVDPIQGSVATVQFHVIAE